MGCKDEVDPRTELDSHANMVVLGKNCFVFEWSGRTCNVHSFSDKLGSMEHVPIVDAAIAYDCPYTYQTYISLMRNELYIPNLENNLIPPFIMREGGAVVNDIAKIHCEDPSSDEPCISFPSSDPRIPLRLHGTFSFFHSRKPTDDEIQSCDKIFITPDSSHWNPYCQSFSLNEESMLNHNGDMSLNERRKKYIMDLEDDSLVDDSPVASVLIKEYDSAIDSVMMESFNPSPCVDNISEDNGFANAFSVRSEISKVMGSIGSCVVDYNRSSDFLSESVLGTIDEIKHLCPDVINDKIIDEIESFTTSNNKGISKSQLSNLWVISEELAKGAIEQNTQHCKHHADNGLSRQLTTNDRMLRYKRLRSVFFTDTFMALKTKSVCGNTCCQIFVSDKGYIAVYPMKSQSEFQDSLNWFCKEVGVPHTLVMDAHKAQKNNATRRFCHQVGTIMRVLEEGTQWANRAELYIGLLKEAVRKDLHQSNAPMRLWDYCAER